jgi:hypothetical protein
MKENDANKLTEVFVGTPWQAELVKGLLESNGIQVAVFVSEKNYESAVTLINENEDKKTD